jgi:hypothetical protein
MPSIPVTAILLVFAGEPTRSVLSQWDAPSDCPQQTEVAHRLREAQLGRPDAALDIAAKITHDGGGYRLRGRVALEGRAQPLLLNHGANCKALVDKLLLFIEPLFPDAEQPNIRPRRFGGFLRGAFEGDVGGLRTCRLGACSELFPHLGGLIAGGWSRRRLRVELGLPLHTRVSRALAVGDFGGVVTRWFRAGVQLRVCGALERVRVDLLFCSELGLQVLLGSPRSTDPGFTPSTPVLLWGTVRAALAAVWWMHPRVGLRIDAAPGLSLRTKEYRAFDRITGTDETRPLAEIALPHAVFSLGLDFRVKPK